MRKDLLKRLSDLEQVTVGKTGGVFSYDFTGVDFTEDPKMLFQDGLPLKGNPSGRFIIAPEILEPEAWAAVSLWWNKHLEDFRGPAFKKLEEATGVNLTESEQDHENDNEHLIWRV